MNVNIERRSGVMLYCSKCRDYYGHYIARHKEDSDIFRRATVTDRNPNGTYQCRCKCGHTWSSRSKEAKKQFDRMRGGLDD